MDKLTAHEITSVNDIKAVEFPRDISATNHPENPEAASLVRVLDVLQQMAINSFERYQDGQDSYEEFKASCDAYNLHVNRLCNTKF